MDAGPFPKKARLSFSLGKPETAAFESNEPKLSDTRARRKSSLVSSFINPALSDAKFKLSTGSFSSSNPDLAKSSSLSKFQELLHNPPKTDSPARGASLMDVISAGVAESVGKKQNMEDRHELVLDVGNHGTGTDGSKNKEVASTPIPHAFFGVYDGHGGPRAAEYVAQHLHKAVVDHPAFEEDTETALREGFKKVEELFSEKVLTENWDGLTGTTVCIALLGGSYLYVANVGDSGAVLCRNGKPMKLSYPHTPRNELEKDRVLSEGGVLQSERLCHPVWNPKLINIAVTRAIGDIYYKHAQFVNDKKSGLIAEPEIARVVVTKDDEFLLLATDGFWDVISPKEAVEFVKQCRSQAKDPEEVCQELTNLALCRATKDDVTVLLVNFQDETSGDGSSTNLSGQSYSRN